MNRRNYEPDPETFSAGYYRHELYSGIAFYVLGWETEPDEDTEWTGIETRTGNVFAVMVGDDKWHSTDPDYLTPLRHSEFCIECGQIGCGCNVLED